MLIFAIYSILPYDSVAFISSIWDNLNSLINFWNCFEVVYFCFFAEISNKNNDFSASSVLTKSPFRNVSKYNNSAKIVLFSTETRFPILLFNRTYKQGVSLKIIFCTCLHTHNEVNSETERARTLQYLIFPILHLHSLSLYVM